MSDDKDTSKKAPDAKAKQDADKAAAAKAADKVREADAAKAKQAKADDAKAVAEAPAKDGETGDTPAPDLDLDADLMEAAAKDETMDERTFYARGKLMAAVLRMPKVMRRAASGEMLDRMQAFIDQFATAVEREVAAELILAFAESDPAVVAGGRYQEQVLKAMSVVAGADKEISKADIQGEQRSSQSNLQRLVGGINPMPAAAVAEGNAQKARQAAKGETTGLYRGARGG
jgi:hypothetical protein